MSTGHWSVVEHVCQIQPSNLSLTARVSQWVYHLRHRFSRCVDKCFCQDGTHGTIGKRIYFSILNQRPYALTSRRTITLPAELSGEWFPSFSRDANDALLTIIYSGRCHFQILHARSGRQVAREYHIWSDQRNGMNSNDTIVFSGFWFQITAFSRHFDKHARPIRSVRNCLFELEDMRNHNPQCVSQSHILLISVLWRS